MVVRAVLCVAFRFPRLSKEYHRCFRCGAISGVRVQRSIVMQGQGIILVKFVYGEFLVGPDLDVDCVIQGYV